jgi:hypothetical protein
MPQLNLSVLLFYAQTHGFVKMAERIFSKCLYGTKETLVLPTSITISQRPNAAGALSVAQAMVLIERVSWKVGFPACTIPTFAFV